ncbi:hypothetical protein D3C81_2230800 [compost metagenome]|jgi:hypothetical protein
MLKPKTSIVEVLYPIFGDSLQGPRLLGDRLRVMEEVQVTVNRQLLQKIIV